LNWQSIPVLEADAPLPFELDGRWTDVVHGGRRSGALDQGALRVIDARVALRTGMQLLAGGARVSGRLGLEPGRWGSRGVVVLEGLRNLRSGRKVEQIIGTHSGVLFATAIQTLRVATSTHSRVFPSRSDIATVGIRTVLGGGTTVSSGGRHQGAAVFDCSARRSPTSGRIPLALSLVARLTAMGVVTGTSAGIAVDRGLAGGLDRTIAPAAAAQDLAVRGVTTDLGVQIRQRLVAIDIKVAGGIGGTAILPRVGNLVRMRV